MISEFALITGLLGWFFFSAFFSGAETGFYVISRVRLAISVSAGEADSVRIQKLLKRPGVLLGTVLVGTNLSNFAASGFGLKLLEHYMPAAWTGTISIAFLNTLIITPFIMVFCEMVPKNVFRVRAYDLSRKVSLPLRIFYFFFLPVNILLVAIIRLFGLSGFSSRAQRMEILSRRAMETHLLEGHEAGAISREQSRIASNILGLEEYGVGDIMVPLQEAAMIPIDIKEEEFRSVVASSRFSRYPVYRDRRDKILGVVNALDILYSDKPFSIEFHLREPRRVNVKEKIGEVLLDLRAARQPLGIAQDASGKAVGIFTIKDLVEEVVGELVEW